LVARVSKSLISPPFLIKIKHPFIRKEYLICGVKDRKDFWKYKKCFYLTLNPSPEGEGLINNYY